MKRLILFILAILMCISGFAQGGYDPVNPGDPNPFRKLTVLASPKAGGSVRTDNGSLVGVGQPVSCHASENGYYQFVHWLKNGEIVSIQSGYDFIMPDEDVEMVAVFELNYNPENPGDPQEAKTRHRVTLTAIPGKGGSFNNSVFKLAEGDSTNVYAYPNAWYKFEAWLMDGEVISTQNPLKVKMADKDLNFSARFSYDYNPSSPSDPAANFLNPETGEMVIDRFEKGALFNELYGLLNRNYDYSDIQSLIVGGTMDGSDFGVMYWLPNCAVIDLSRTNGFSEIPSYAFESLSALTDIIIPACVTTIGSYAFFDCRNLSVITCYSPIPPSVSEGAFEGVDKFAVIKVPLQSVDVYKNAAGWKEFTILPADADLYSITVTLPSDAKDGRYRNMSVELLNASNGQRYRYLITDKTEYVFGNLFPSAVYSVAVKNSRDEILGEISDLKVADHDLTASFQSLLQPRSVSVKVTTPEGKDITKDVTVKWLNDSDELLRQGPVLTGVLENSTVGCMVILPQQLQSVYLQPSAQTVKVSDSNILVCKLDAVGTVVLSGKITDNENQPLPGAVITVSQKINGSYILSANASCDSHGNYSIEVPDLPVKTTISAKGYISRTNELQSASEGLGDVMLEKATGIIVFPSYIFRESVAAGVQQSESDWYSDDANIAYRVEDTDGNEIAGCIFQSGSIILPSYIALNEDVILTAYSKTGKFREVSQAVTLSTRSVYVSLPIVEYGAINVKLDDAMESANICLLYDASGNQVGKALLRGDEVTFANLPDGTYSLIVMNNSALLGSIQNLSSLKETPLGEGIDYLVRKIDVESGKISETEIADVPDLDESKLYFTDSSDTYFMPNKQQLTIGNYVTLKAKVTVKDEYAGAVKSATLIVDIPSNCELVDNSIISGSGYPWYEYVGNRLSIPIERISDVVRFCIIPLEGAECKPTAFVKLIFDGRVALQPIGTAYFEAQNFSLAAPEKTGKTEIVVRGTATPNSEVNLYDNDVFVGSVYSSYNGEWVARMSLVKPYNYSLHSLYAEIISNDGHRLLTETKTVEYEELYPISNTITMFYGEEGIVFDNGNGCVSQPTYIYQGLNYFPDPIFTFVADFGNLNSEIFHDVVFKVKQLDGAVRAISGEFNEASGRWVATDVFTSTQAPVNVTVEYVTVDNNQYCKEAFNDQIEGLINANSKLLEIFNNDVSLSTATDEDNLFEGSLMYGDVELPFKTELLDFDSVYNREMNEKQFYPYGAASDKVYYRVGSDDDAMVCTIVDANEKFALNITVSLPENSDNIANAPCWSWITPMRNSFNNGSFLKNFSGAAGNVLDIFGVAEYINVRGDFNQMMDNAVRYSNNYIQMRKRTMDLALAKCKDGSYKLTPGQLKLLEEDLKGLAEREDDFSDRYYQYLTDYKKALGWNIAGNVASLGVGKLIGAASKLIKKGSGIVKWFNRHVNCAVDAETVGETVTNSLGIAYSGVQEGVDKTVHPAFYDFNGVRDKLWTWSHNEFTAITNEFIRLNDLINKSYRKCPDGDENADDEQNEKVYYDKKENFVTPSIVPIIDPSGYVYEAVPSNRVPGVTATAYFKQQSENMYGEVTETAVAWDAAPFGQENPLITDDQGMYAWDVPSGMWQVRFEKEGYEPTQSAWLPVPPPQLDVNVAITQAKQPEVKRVHAFNDGLTIDFDKFMLPTSLNTDNIIVTQNGKVVNGAVEASDLELNADGNAFCSKIEFKPTKPLESGEVTLFVSKAVKSYANIGMSEDFSQSFTVEPRISEIKIEEQLDLSSGSTLRVSASIIPADAAKGKTILVESSNDMIASVSPGKCKPDAKGNISFDLFGKVPGSTDLKISVEDYDVNADVNVKVTSPRNVNQVATPYASIETGEVETGTEIYLYCATEDATIYYTLDGSCPCDVNRLRYSGSPIIAVKNMTLKVMAEAEGLEDSEVAEYNYSVISTSVDEIQLDKVLEIYPLPLGDYLNISNGDYAIDEVSIFDMNGNLMVHSNKSADRISLKVGFLTPGWYLLNVMTNGQSIVKKVIKQ